MRLYLGIHSLVIKNTNANIVSHAIRVFGGFVTLYYLSKSFNGGQESRAQTRTIVNAGPLQRMLV